MEASLGVPTATSFRDVPAKLLEVNRKVINGYLSPQGRRQGLLHPHHRLRRRAGHRRRRPRHERRRSSRTPTASPGWCATRTSAWASRSTSRSPTAAASLLVPCIKDADTLDFAEFHATLRGAHPQGPHQQADPRRLRRRHRLPHQPRHHRHRASRSPASCPARASSSASAPSTTPPSGRPPTPRRSPSSASPRSSPSAPPTTTASSRAPSRACSSGSSTSCSWARTEFYDGLFRSIGVPYEAVQVAPRHQPERSRRSRARQADAGDPAHQPVPGARPPHRRPRPAGRRRAGDAPRARPGHLRPHHLGPRPRVPHRRRHRHLRARRRPAGA